MRKNRVIPGAFFFAMCAHRQEPGRFFPPSSLCGKPILTSELYNVYEEKEREKKT